MARNSQQSTISQLPDRDDLDLLRKELEGKIKDESHTMKWFLGILVVILLAVFGYYGYQLAKIDGLTQRATILETKFDNFKESLLILEKKMNPSPEIQREFH